jgi:hypothetical protein
MSEERSREPETPDGRAAADHPPTDPDPDEERPIEVKRTPRLRSGKHEESESPE